MTKPWRRRASDAPYEHMTIGHVTRATRNGNVVESTFTATPVAPSRIEWDVAILRGYKRELDMCVEDACNCACRCHTGDDCIYECKHPGHVGVDADADVHTHYGSCDPVRFHSRKAGSGAGHKKGHRS